ncbi:hypothetical protein Gorai_021098 [Gossypium raimondii]|uniref:Protein kinase domain-containing protein n=1 Tax=Gossypium raimondii TaxID=29730 RepID=A0A7J8NPI2_GOSRA|nr:hypothetical protein [Gossypium raimondii]
MCWTRRLCVCIYVINLDHMLSHCSVIRSEKKHYKNLLNILVSANAMDKILKTWQCIWFKKVTIMSLSMMCCIVNYDYTSSPFFCYFSGPILFVKKFSYKDVKRATDGFHRIVYSNSHGAAYKANFEGGEVALVKEARAFDEGKESFYREVQFLGRLHHRHLLSLRGFSTGQKRLLVFDNIENGSLKEHFNGKSIKHDLCVLAKTSFCVFKHWLLTDPLRTPLNWKARLQIAVGVAAALEYLLLFSNPPVYHVSISSSNIMLDENFTAKLSDVGLLSSIGTYVQMPHSSCSEECMDQECGNIVYQLGVLILELITGQSSEKGGTDLIQWVQGSRLSSSIHMMIDPDLGNNYDAGELKKLLVVARLCIKSKSNPKFPVSQVFRFLQKKVHIPRD